MVVLAVVAVGVVSGDSGVIGECWSVKGVRCSESTGDRECRRGDVGGGDYGV